jgi:predicted CXXCH cytochrome family protein
MAGSYLIIFLTMLISRGISTDYKSGEPLQESCITCHGDLIKNNVVHPELATTCDICHASTGAKHPEKNVKGFTLSEKLPVLCYNCHSDFQEHIDAYPSVHGALKDTVSCMNCHNPHSSAEKRLLINGTNDLCLRCHDKTIVNDSMRIRNISQTLSRAKSIHQPVEQGGCVNCHNPHFSEKRALLIGNFPSEQYIKASTDNLELCFMCHDTDLLEKATTEAGTNFRDGTKNLHFVHLSGDKGRNCTMCHDVHGAANDRLIVDKLKFGSWEMKISFTASGNGGSCLTACHSEKKYDRTIIKIIPKKAETRRPPVKQSAPQKTTHL